MISLPLEFRKKILYMNRDSNKLKNLHVNVSKSQVTQAHETHKSWQFFRWLFEIHNFKIRNMKQSVLNRNGWMTWKKLLLCGHIVWKSLNFDEIKNYSNWILFRKNVHLIYEIHLNQINFRSTQNNKQFNSQNISKLKIDYTFHEHLLKQFRPHKLFELFEFKS